MPNRPQNDGEEPLIDVETAAGFVRRLSHDVRNTLNALDLQLLLLESGDPVVNQGITQARQMITAEARRLARISAQFQLPRPQWVVYPAADLLQDLLPRMQKRVGSGMVNVEWPEAVPNHEVKIDFEMFAELLGELIFNAMHHGESGAKVKVQTAVRDHTLNILLTESLRVAKGNPSHWGTVPFRADGKGGYGLGLFCCRRMAQAMGLQLDFHYQPANALLTTSLALPIVEAHE